MRAAQHRWEPAAVKHISDPDVMPETIMKVVPFDACAVALALRLNPTPAHDVRNMKASIAEIAEHP